MEPATRQAVCRALPSEDQGLAETGGAERDRNSFGVAFAAVAQADKLFRELGLFNAGEPAPCQNYSRTGAGQS